MAENAFPNAGTTAGSVASILTGKLPIDTRLIYPPDILNGKDAYQHLPGILKRLGYHTVDLSVPYFGDALTLNMQGGFDVVNERSGADNFAVKTSRVLGGADYVGELFEYLTDSNTLNNTILIVYPDHGMRWTIHQRVPLIFWFPEEEYKGRVQDNVQNIDIAPTILSHLGVPIPEWMKGQALIQENRNIPEY